MAFSARRKGVSNFLLGCAVLTVFGVITYASPAHAGTGTITVYKVGKATIPQSDGTVIVVDRTHCAFNASWTSQGYDAVLNNWWVIQPAGAPPNYPAQKTVAGTMAPPTITLMNGSFYASFDGYVDSQSYSTGWFEGDLNLVQHNGSTILEQMNKATYPAPN